MGVCVNDDKLGVLIVLRVLSCCVPQTAYDKVNRPRIRNSHHVQFAADATTRTTVTQHYFYDAVKCCRIVNAYYLILSGGLLTCLSVWNEVQTYVWPS